ncbi:MAG: cyclic nucleotide-binding domain-containing protein [Chloroflexi bacterium]|nr:cyclic nucleotide-binding domain-containing protein [Chloroflexota bacterium]
MLDALPHIPFFMGLNAEQLATLAKAFDLCRCATGAVIFEQGDPASHVYLILKGRVITSYKPYDGPRIIISRLKDGDVFGWSAVVGSAKYSSSVVCETDLEALRLHREVLRTLANYHPETSRLIIDRLALNVSPRWKNAHEQIASLIR